MWRNWFTAGRRFDGEDLGKFLSGETEGYLVEDEKSGDRGSETEGLDGMRFLGF